jgi:hypothetical protein
LSATGREIYEAVAPMAIRYQQHLLAGLSDADQAKFDHLIRHLMERASAPWRPAPLPHHRKR